MRKIFVSILLFGSISQLYAQDWWFKFNEKLASVNPKTVYAQRLIREELAKIILKQATFDDGEKMMVDPHDDDRRNAFGECLAATQENKILTQEDKNILEDLANNKKYYKDAHDILEKNHDNIFKAAKPLKLAAAGIAALAVLYAFRKTVKKHARRVKDVVLGMIIAALFFKYHEKIFGLFGEDGKRYMKKAKTFIDETVPKLWSRTKKAAQENLNDVKDGLNKARGNGDGDDKKSTNPALPPSS